MNMYLKKIGCFTMSIVGCLLLQLSVFGAASTAKSFIPTIVPQSRGAGRVILVLGTSSAGKSTLSKKLNAIIRESGVLSMDDMGDEFDCGLNQVERNQYPGEWITDELRLLCKKILELTGQGMPLIVDAILQEAIEDGSIDQTASFISYLKSHNHAVYSILVYCPPIQLVHNVNKRNNVGREVECRSPVAVVGEFLETYVERDAEVTAITKSPVGPIPADEFVEVMDLFRNMSVGPRLERAKALLLNRLSSLSSSRTPSPVQIATNNYDFIFNSTDETFASELKRLEFAISKWMLG